MHTLKTAALAGALVLALAGSASALTATFNESAFRIAWERLEFAYSGGASEVMRCPVTLEGTFHSATTTLVRNTSIGDVTRAASGTCTGGRLTILTMALPWPLTFRSSFGSPTTLELSTDNLGWQTTIEGITCLARGTSESIAGWWWRTDEARRVVVRGDQNINLPVTGLGCETLRLAYEGATFATRAGSSTNLTVTYR